MPFRTRSRPALLLLGAALLGSGLLACSAPTDQELKIATGGEDGTFYPLGAQLAWLLDNGSYPGVESALAIATNGSLENLELLRDGKAELALVGETKLRGGSEEVSALAGLYTTVLHVLARPGLRLGDLEALGERAPNEPPLTIFMDARGSGARLTAQRVLDRLRIDQKKYVVDEASSSYLQAAKRLVAGEIDLAIIHEAMPSEEVAFAMTGGADLIGLGAAMGELGVAVTIPKYLYANQAFPISTIGDPALLVARADLGDEVAVSVLRALFEHASELATAHPIATDIRTRGLLLASDLPRHPGVALFEQREEENLVIAAGPALGAYYEIGRVIQSLLEDRGIASSVLQTDGSLANLELLSRDRPTAAIVQYDIALASHSYDPKAVYKSSPPRISDRNGKSLVDEDGPGAPQLDWGIESVKSMRRIATLLEESMYVFARTTRDGEPVAHYSTSHGDLRVCFGAQGSGTQVLARAVFGDSENKLGRAVFLPVEQMIRQLQNNHLDVGFAVTSRRSAMVPQLLADESITLENVRPQTIERLRGPAIQPHEVSSSYGAGKDGADSVTTIKTDGVLVVNTAVPDQIARILAETVVAGRDHFLDLSGANQDDLLRRLVSSSSAIALHREAEKYYKQQNLLPSVKKKDWVILARNVLTLVLGLITLASAVIGSRTRLVVNDLERRIIATDLGAETHESVRQLADLQAEAKDALERRWWTGRSLNTAKWRSIDALIQKRMDIARQLLTRMLVKRVRRIRAAEEPDGLDEKYAALKDDVVRFFEAGELTSEQYSFLLAMVREETDSG